MIVDTNRIVGQYACPKDHPVTCANPAPWEIKYIKLETSGWDKGVTVWIRGYESMWFRADSCYIGDQTELQMWLELEERKRLVKVTTLCSHPLC